MRPAHVYANLSDEQYHDLVNALHRQWRTATRTVMILLSAGGMPATEIAALLHYDPATVRRWITRHQHEGLTGLPDRPRSGRPPHRRPTPERTHQPAPGDPESLDHRTALACPRPTRPQPEHPAPSYP